MGKKVEILKSTVMKKVKKLLKLDATSPGDDVANTDVSFEKQFVN